MLQVIALWHHRLILASPFVIAVFLAVVRPDDDGATFCPFALCTGMACPGCGMTRATSYMIRGDIGTALAYHPLAPLTAIGTAAAWGWFMMRLTGRVTPLSQRTVNVILIGAAAALIAVWVGRLLTGTLPPV